MKMYNITDVTQLIRTPSSPDVTSNNSTGELNKSDDTEFYRQTAHVIRCILCVLIICLNILVIVLTLRVKKLRSRMLFFVVNLAIADLTVGLLYVFPDALEDITIDWRLGSFTCKLKWYLSNTVMFSSTYLLVAMSLDRLYVVIRPIESSTKGLRSAVVMVTTVWIISALMATPMMKLCDVLPRDDILTCTIELHEPHLQIYVTVYFLLIVLVPGFVVASCYIGIVWVIGRKAIMQRLQQKQNYSGDHPLRKSDCLRTTSTLLPRAKAKSLLMTFVIVITYTICWVPFFTYFMLQAYGVIGEKKEKFLMQALAPLNSAANPVICIIFNFKLFCEDFFFFKPSKKETFISEFTNFTAEPP